MHRMTGMDASFLYMESPRLPMHTLKLVIVDVADVPGGYRFERVAEVVAAHLHLLPALRRRALAVPLGLHHPVWIDDPAFRIGDHIERVVLPEGAGDAELDAFTASVTEGPLDRRRPLWHMWAIEGMRGAEGRPLVAFLVKIHHAIADGVAAEEMLRLAMSELDGSTPLGSGPTPLPDRVALALGALRDHLRQRARLPRLLLGTLRGGLRAMWLTRRAEVKAPRLFSAPRTVFNHKISSRRNFARVELPLPEFRRIKAVFACTINDVVLAVVAGALRAYLLGRGEAAEFPLIASVPACTDHEIDNPTAGNHVSSLYTSLRVDLADPVERLEATRQVTDAAKAKHAAMGSHMLTEWMEFSRLAPHAWLWRRLLPRLARPPLHLVVSNVPGPREPLAIDGARLVRLASVGPLLEGVGLNITVWSYIDTMSFAVLASPDGIPELAPLIELLRTSLAELGAAADRRVEAEAQVPVAEAG
ncbi:MAG TPA: wax ester/triacylglycerol synthase family O-acyltransferase [Nannocystis sp.]|jgi:diacylglycerol O-acyltransferase